MIFRDQKIIAINELPEDTDSFMLGIVPNGNVTHVIFESKKWTGKRDKYGDCIIELPPGIKDATVIGMHGFRTSLKEEECKELVVSGINDNETYYYRYDRMSFFCSLKSAQRSFKSWLKNNKLTVSNPYGNILPGGEENPLFEKWREAQERSGPFLILKEL